MLVAFKSQTFCQLAGALAEEGCSLEQIVSKVTEVLKGIGKSLLQHLIHISFFPG